MKAQATDHLLFDGYDQDAWVRAQRYSERPWADLVVLWKPYNLHVANVMASADPVACDRPRQRHSLHQIAFVRISPDQPATLTGLMRDYVAHLEHHLRQALKPLALRCSRHAGGGCSHGTTMATDVTGCREEGVESMATIGLIGAGHIGAQVARLAVANGYDVVISNSRGPETLAALASELGPRARAATPDEAARAGDIVVVSVPLKNYRDVPAGPLAGKLVIDTNNYYPERDGHIPELDNESTTTAELLQAHLGTAKVVKAFNHIYAAELTTHGQPPGTANRRALVIAGDDEGAKATVSRLLDQFGFDTVDAGPLKEGWRIQRDTPGYGPRRTAEQLRRDLAAARRYRDQ